MPWCSRWVLGGGVRLGGFQDWVEASVQALLDGRGLLGPLAVLSARAMPPSPLPSSHQVPATPAACPRCLQLEEFDPEWESREKGECEALNLVGGQGALAGWLGCAAVGASCEWGMWAVSRHAAVESTPDWRPAAFAPPAGDCGADGAAGAADAAGRGHAAAARCHAGAGGLPQGGGGGGGGPAGRPAGGGGQGGRRGGWVVAVCVGIEAPTPVHLHMPALPCPAACVCHSLSHWVSTRVHC